MRSITVFLLSLNTNVSRVAFGCEQEGGERVQQERADKGQQQRQEMDPFTPVGAASPPPQTPETSELSAATCRPLLSAHTSH